MRTRVHALDILLSKIGLHEPKLPPECLQALRSAVQQSLEPMLKRADAALYRAKHEGRNQIIATSA